MKTMKYFIGFIIILMGFTVSIIAQPQPGNCVSKNESFRQSKNQEMLNPSISPLPAADLSSFTGLFYYPIDCKYVVNAVYSPLPAKMTKLGTTDGKKVQLYDVGMVTFTFDGKEKSLRVYQNVDLPEFSTDPETIFIPIKDGTTANGTTYANGRYVIINPPADGGEFMLDFNMATNPYQNYNSEFSSLVVPAENEMDAPLQVGERKYEDRTR
jgi:hypothetical protein